MDTAGRGNERNINKETLFYTVLQFQPQGKMFCCPVSLWPEVSSSQLAVLS